MNDQKGTAGPCADDREPFCYQGYQVVRRGFLAHTQEPAITFSQYQLAVNTSCLKKLPQADYIQVLVNSDTKKLVIRPCGEDEKDSFAWKSVGKSGCRPRRVTCRIFYAKLTELMGWEPDLRYKLLGKLIRANEEQLLIFDLMEPQVFQRTASAREARQSSRTPIFPAAWKDQFGLPAEAHPRSLQISLFQGYAVFGIRLPAPPPPCGQPVEEVVTLEQQMLAKIKEEEHAT